MSFLKKLGKGLLHGATRPSTITGVGAIVVGAIADDRVAHVVQAGVNAAASRDPVAVISLALGIGGLIFSHKPKAAETG